MAIGYSQEELRRKLQHAPILPSKIAGKIIKSATGLTSISTAKAKQILPKILKGKSKLGREKIYRELGLTYSEKKRVEEIIAGGKTPEQLRKEKERYDIFVKRNKAIAKRAQYNQNVQAEGDVQVEGGGVAAKLLSGRQKMTGEKRKKERVDRAIVSQGEKVSYRNLGIENEKAKNAKTSVLGDKINAKTKTPEQRSSISRKPENTTGLTGLSLPNRELNPSNRPNIPMASNL